MSFSLRVDTRSLKIEPSDLHKDPVGAVAAKETGTKRLPRLAKSRS
jgi:hypothetical protein